MGIPLSRTETLPDTVIPQSGVPDTPAASSMVRSPKLEESGLMENRDHPWTRTFPVIKALESVKFPPITVTFPLTPPPIKHAVLVERDPNVPLEDAVVNAVALGTRSRDRCNVYDVERHGLLRGFADPIACRDSHHVRAGIVRRWITFDCHPYDKAAGEGGRPPLLDLLSYVSGNGNHHLPWKMAVP
jgi:hypothetical protein